MRKVVLFFTFLVYGLIGYSQINVTQYFNPELPILNLDDHMEIDFTWNMKGELQALINEGINSLDEGQVNNALANLNRAIKLDSSLWISHYYRGVCHKKTRLFDLSDQDFLTAIAFNPKAAEPHIELAENYIATDKFREASYHLDAAIELNSALPQGYHNLAAIAFLEGNIIKATRLYKKANEVGPKYPDAYLMQGVLLMVQKGSKKGIEFISKSILADSSYSTGYFWRGLVLLEEGKTEECLKDWNKLIQYNPENPMYIMMRGYLYIELKQFDKAFVDFKKALKAQEVDQDKFAGKQSILDKEIDLHAAANYLIANGYGLDETAFAFLKKGFCLLLARNAKDALESLTHAENIQPSATVYFLKAIAFEHLGKHYEALEYYSRALKRDNDIFDAHKKRSVYRLELKDWAGVNEDLQNMFRLQPNSPVAYRLSGLVKAHQGNYEAAVNDLSKFIDTDTTDSEIYRTRVVCYTMLNKRDEAHTDIVLLLKKQPDNWILHNEMSDYYLVLKDTTQALVVVQDYIDRNIEYAIPYRKLAEIYMAKKDFGRATELIQKMKSMINETYQPTIYSELYMWEGMIAAHNNDYSSAIDRYSKALKRDTNNMDARYHRAKTYQLTGEQKRAKEDLKILSENDFKDSKALYSSLPVK